MLCRVSFVLIMVLSTSAYAQQPEKGSPLLDLTEVQIEVAKLPFGARYTGITEEQIYANVELRLREGGIDVSDEALTTLYVDVNVVTTDDVTFAVSSEIQLEEKVYSDRKKDLYFNATTWQMSALGLFDDDEVLSRTEGLLETLIDHLLREIEVKNRTE